MKKQNVNNPAMDEEYINFVLSAFDHATDEMLNDETKAEALQLARLYIDAPAMPESSSLFGIMTGFLMGLSEGMRIADAMNAAAAEKKAAQ